MRWLGLSKRCVEIAQEYAARREGFGVKLKEAMDKIGVEANFQAKNKPQDKYKDLVDFLIVKLTGS